MSRAKGITIFCLTIMVSTALIFHIESRSVVAMQAQQGNNPSQEDEDERARGILLERFTRSRPAPPNRAQTHTVSTTGRYRARPGSQSAAIASRRPRYHRASPKLPSPSLEDPAEVGVTIWRLRPSKPSDSGERLLVMEGPNRAQWIPERIEAGAPLRVGDRVRLTIESPRAGYLYVVDREQYLDGSMGDAYLIFPTMRTHGGDNRVRPGKLIDIPAQEDDPSYFTLVPSPSREDQVGEILSVIVTTEPLENLPLSDKPLKLSKTQIAKWEKQWGAQVERYELEGGAGRAWTREEKAASQASGRYLTQEEPSPQTIYLVEGKSNKGLLVTVPLRYRR